MFVVGTMACARVVALDGLTRHGFPLRWLKPTRVSWATVKILTQRQNRNAYQRLAEKRPTYFPPAHKLLLRFFLKEGFF